jgi:hypothetical protein
VGPTAADTIRPQRAADPTGIVVDGIADKWRKNPAPLGG